MFGEVDVHQRHGCLFKEQSEHLAHPGLECIEVRLLGLSRDTQSDAAQAEERGLFGCGQRSGMPDGIAEIAAEVQTREHDVDAGPEVGAQGDAVGGGAIDAISGKAFDEGGPAIEWTGGGDGMAHGGLLDVGSNDTDFTEMCGGPGQGEKAGTINPVII